MNAILCGRNPISRLQEICQQWALPPPVYREASGTYSQFGSEVTFTVEGSTVTFNGMGRNKKMAKTRSAEEALIFLAATKPHLLEHPPPPDPVSTHPPQCV